MGMAQCMNRRGAARCQLGPHDRSIACKYPDNPKQKDNGDWVYTDHYGDTITLAHANLGGPDGHVYIEFDGDDRIVELHKNDVEAFLAAVREISSRPPKCTRCKGSGKEPR